MAHLSVFWHSVEIEPIYSNMSLRLIKWQMRWQKKLTESKKCPECGKAYQLNKEFFPNLTITYYGCGHQNIAVVVNEAIGITEKIDRDIQEDYAELGKVYLGGPLFAKTFDPIEKGKIRFEEIREELFKFLCKEKQLCEKIKKWKI